jgi:hypothetical protein
LIDRQNAMEIEIKGGKEKDLREEATKTGKMM